MAEDQTPNQTPPETVDLGIQFGDPTKSEHEIGTNIPRQHLERLGAIVNPANRDKFVATRVKINGVEATVVCLVDTDHIGSFRFYPQLILMSDELMDSGAIKLSDLDGDEPKLTEERNPERNLDTKENTDVPK